jgi:subtilisin family serine protease
MLVRPILSFFVPLARRLWPAVVVMSLLVAASMPIGWTTNGIKTGLGTYAQAQAQEATPPSGDVIVVFKDRQTNPRTVAESDNAHPRHIYRHAVNGFSAHLTERQVNHLLRRHDVAFISPNIQVHAADQTLPTGVDRVDADQNPIAKIDGTDQRVDADIAIIDSGIDLSNSDLNVAGGVDCTGAGSYNDSFGHGTHVAGIAAAVDNSSGVVGVAPGARLWSVRVLNASGNGLLDDVLCGLDWVVAHADTIDVANMSIEGDGVDATCTHDAFHLAICNTVNAGVPVVVAAGNGRKDASSVVPAAFDQVITVSAFTDYDGKPGGKGSAPAGCGSVGADDTFLTAYSNYGPAIDIAAPGSCILSTIPGGLGYKTGTSMATPHVTGAVALFKSVNPGASPDQVRAWLMSVSQPQNGPYGFTGDPDSVHEPVLWLGTNVQSVPKPTPAPGAAFAEQSGLVTMEAEHAQTRLSRSDHGWYERNGPLSITNFIGDSFMRVEPDSGAYWTSNYATTAPELQYVINFQTTGTYYVWVRARAEDYAGDSLHAGLDGAPLTTADSISVPAGAGWVWTNGTMDGPSATINVTTPGQHTLNIWAREDGLRLDRILLTTSRSYAPNDTGPAESPRVDDLPKRPTAQLSTTRTTVNVRVTATVTGYPASAPVQILWKGTSVGSFKTDARGTGSGDFKVPATPMGFYPVALVSGSTSLTTQFEVVPRIKLTPAKAAPGDTIDVSLRGYRKKETVRIRWKQGSSWVELTRVLTSNTGSANIKIPVPSWAPDGPASVRGDSTDADGARAQTNAFVVDSSLKASEPTPTVVITPTPMIDTSPPFVEQQGAVVIEAEHAHLNASRGDHTWIGRTDIADYAGDGFMRVEPDNGWYLTSNYVGASPELQYQVEFAGPGTYYLWVRAMAQDGAGNSLHVGLDGAASPGGQGVNLAQTDGAWHWTGTTLSGTPATLQIPAPGVHTINVWMREDGLRLDRIIVTADPNFVPDGLGPDESPRSNVAAASAAETQTPTATPAASPSVIAEPTTVATVVGEETATVTATLTPEPTQAQAEPTMTPEATEPVATVIPPTPTVTPTEPASADESADAASTPGD